MDFRNLTGIFTKQAQKESTEAAKRRMDAVGLLTPDLMKEHISSGQDLVLAYGRKGGSTSFNIGGRTINAVDGLFTLTLRDLKYLADASDRAQKSYLHKSAGVPIAALEGSSWEADRQRSKNVKSALLFKIQGNELYFQVQGNIKPHYLVRIRLEDWKETLKNPSINYSQAARQAAMGRVSFDCACGRHQYWFRYLACIGGFAFTPPEEQDFPKIRNPGLGGCCCKHALKVLRVLKTNAIHAFLAQEMEKQAKSVGFADQKAKMLGNNQLKQVFRARGISGQTPESRAALKKFSQEAKRIVSTPKAEEARKKLRPRGKAPAAKMGGGLSRDARKVMVETLRSASMLKKTVPGAVKPTVVIDNMATAYHISKDEVRAIMKEEGIRL